MLALQPGKTPKKISTATLPKNLQITEFHKWYVKQIACMFGIPIRYWR